MITKYRQCKHFKYRYTYKPSIGDFGRICPKCHKWQREFMSIKRETKNEGK